jgi:hypothetical protein
VSYFNYICVIAEDIRLGRRVRARANLWRFGDSDRTLRLFSTPIRPNADTFLEEIREPVVKMFRHVSERTCVPGIRGVEQDPRCFNGVPGKTDDTRPLSMIISLLVGVHDPGHLSGFIMFDP